MRNRKWTLFQFSNGDFKGVEVYLNEQAAKGWELEKAGAFLARWKRTERNDLTWCVDLMNPKQSREEQTEYLALCADGGWEPVAIKNQMCLLRSRPGRSPAHAQTDPEIEENNYKQYYVKRTIRYVLGLAAIVVLSIWFLTSLTGTYGTRGLENTRYDWYVSWVASVLPLLCIVGIPSATWRTVDFIRAMVVCRREGVIFSPRWIMWGNCVMGLIWKAAWLIYCVCYLVEFVYSSEFFSLVPMVILAGIILYLLFKAADWKELYPGELKGLWKSVAAVLVVLALLIGGRYVGHYGQWSGQDTDEEVAEAYQLTEEVPLLRYRDLGLSLQPEGSFGKGTTYFDHALTPVGELWKEKALYWNGPGWMTGCESYACFTRGQAKWLVQRLVDRAEWSTDIEMTYGPGGADMASVELDWADEAWYGLCEEDEVNVHALVIRRGRQVFYITALIPLVEEAQLAIIEDRLCKEV